jgi:NAD(P)H-quinone oxidoreductase subunit 6
MSRKIYIWFVLAALVIAFVGYIGAQVAQSTVAPANLALGPVTLRDVLFYGLAGLAVAGAACVALSRNILYSALGLLFALMGAGSIYIFLSADFLAVTQLLVYIGGVLVLILFAVMLTNRITEVNISNKSLGIGGGIALLLATAPMLIFVAVTTPWAQRVPAELAPTTRDIGNAFLTRWLLPFELASLVLLATLIGAVVIARKELKQDEPDPAAR